jgi:hypothetical protein
MRREQAGNATTFSGLTANTRSPRAGGMICPPVNGPNDGNTKPCSRSQYTGTRAERLRKPPSDTTGCR